MTAIANQQPEPAALPAPARPPLAAVPAPVEERRGETALESLAGSSVSAEWLARIYGADVRRVEHAVDKGMLLALRPDGARERLIPLWQLDDTGRPLGTLGRVLAEARRAGLDGLALHRLMQSRLGLTDNRRVADSLRAGRVEHVLDVVRAYAAA